MKMSVIKVGSPTANVLLTEGTTLGRLLEQLENESEFSGAFQKFLNGQPVASLSQGLDTVLKDGDTLTLSPKIDSGR